MSGLLGTDLLGVLGGGATAVDLAKIDLTSPDSVLNSNGMTYDVTVQGAGYRASLTGDNHTRDGATEGVSLLFAPKDVDGNVVDLSGGKWAVAYEVEIDSAVAGDSLIVMFGVLASDAGAPQWARLGGFTTHTSAIRRSVATSVLSNSTTGTADLTTIRGQYIPAKVDDGSFVVGGHLVWTMNSSGEFVNYATAGAGVDSIGDDMNLALFLGFDAGHTNTKTADLTVRAVAIQVRD